ncbi:hypothetical protein [Marinobacter zhanjiangensis]|uniref:Uncharacterized protein n=1 Tax=Marinobacter zhanjiangensis TaxID=578215 RepID=A0ABQ3AU56_9GAMM|nr:hypothetical protein [Marinobacter zhanjiangensis]GGY66171.1 hypothetical protein GCM10007071_11200 [Marinobacter zhanjiangensis]
MDLEEQLSDSRSNEAAYRVRIENLGSAVLDLVNLNPQIPDGVELVEVKDSSTVAAKERHAKLCEDLTQILKDYLFAENEEVQNRILDIEKNHIHRIIQDINPFYWRAYFKLFTGFIEKSVERVRKERSSMAFVISSSEDAAIAIDKWFLVQNGKGALETLFLSKLEQVKEIESTIGKDSREVAIANIEPDSFYATTYVLKFERSMFSAKKFNFTVEGQFREKEKTESRFDSVSTTVSVSPRPYVLSIIAVLSALLGVSLKYSVEQNASASLSEFFSALGTQLATGPGISSGILALLMFNIFEHTSLSRSIKIGVNWQGALLVGVVCGLFSERMIEALKALVGA